MEDLERWINLEEIAQYIGCSKDTIRGWIRKRQFHFTKLEDNINSRCLKLITGFKAAKVPMQINEGGCNYANR